MPKERYRIFVDMQTNEENIVDMFTGPLTIDETCDKLNELTKENKSLKEENWKITKAKQGYSQQNSRLRVLLKELDEENKKLKEMNYNDCKD